MPLHSLFSFFLSLCLGMPAFAAKTRTLRNEVTVAEIETLHSSLRKHDLFKTIYGKQGCYSRASVVSFILEMEKGLNSQLVWLHGCEMTPVAYWNTNLDTHWFSHVATLVKVRTSSGVLQSWVLDLSFRAPMRVRTWLRRLNVTEPLAVSPDEAMFNPPPFRCVYTTTERYQHLSPRGLTWTGWKADHLFRNMQMLEDFIQLQAGYLSKR